MPSFSGGAAAEDLAEPAALRGMRRHTGKRNSEDDPKTTDVTETNMPTGIAGEFTGHFNTGPLDMAPTFDYSYDGFMRSVEQSLHRLATHRLDIVLIHDVDVIHHGERIDDIFRTAMDDGYRALDELRRSGDVGAIGVGVNESEMCVRFARAGDFDCMLLAGRYTLYEQGALDEFLPLVRRRTSASSSAARSIPAS